MGFGISGGMRAKASGLQNNTGASVVELVGHTILDGGVSLDINVVAEAVVGKVGAHVWHATLAEWPREHVTCAAAVSF